MIGIIGAMDIEISLLTAAMSDCEEFTCCSQKFLWGRIGGCEVVVSKCGIGKVNAAMCASIMILKFGADIIINTGVAGALDRSLKQLDLVISSAFVQHDIDLSPIGIEPGLIPENGSVSIASDAELSALALSLAPSPDGAKAITGVIATGDQFIADSGRAADIAARFGAAACDMEGGAIAQVCAMSGIKLIALRCISDNADGSAGLSFDEFAPQAADKCSNMVLRLLDAIAKKDGQAI
ncbi:MAG: 5'-methylthioadenosine/adenosylhomocysteine nucleosidase [Clostridia bacterium]|nr:5'-methylthioadenosine/adenosylhomocysteine nucleosidase [Clostridia bacterium]